MLAMSLCLLASCTSDEERLAKRQQQAEQQTAVLCDALIHNSSLDTIRTIAPTGLLVQQPPGFR